MYSRKNESPKPWFRSERVFRSSGRWFFHTREGIEVGPYSGRFEAEVDVGILRSMLAIEPPNRARAAIRRFMMHVDDVQFG